MGTWEEMLARNGVNLTCPDKCAVAINPLRQDYVVTANSFSTTYESLQLKEKSKTNKVLKDIKKVIYNGPATIIIWKDKTKTVIKCKEGDPYSKEAGLALCILKKIAGEEFHKTLRIWCKDDPVEENNKNKFFADNEEIK